MTKEMNYSFKFAALVLLFVGIIACEGKLKEEKHCIEQTIEEIQSSPVWNPPAKIYQYRYNGQIVYYIPARCCDIPSVLLDKNCNPIGYTNGYTEKPDSIMTDFEKKRTDEKLIWEDKRSYEIDMSVIDFSNIENLYEQPLPVIQKAVQGKWHWMQYIGGDAGTVTMDMDVVEITSDKMTTYEGTQYFLWQKQDVNNIKTYIMWNIQQNIPICYFESIKNDTMRVSGFKYNAHFNQFIKIKN